MAYFRGSTLMNVFECKIHTLIQQLTSNCLAFHFYSINFHVTYHIIIKYGAEANRVIGRNVIISARNDRSFFRFRYFADSNRSNSFINLFINS
jgi:hypothetical protein